MDAWIERKKVQFELFRDRTFASIARFLLDKGISAMFMTTISLLGGLAAVYFLFQNHLYFTLFSVLHLTADALDGVMARQSIKTEFGKYFDYGTDRIVTFLLIIKIGWLFSDSYAYFAAGLLVIVNVIYIISRFTAPIVFTRTITVLLLMGYLPELVTVTAYFPTLAYLVTGVASAYSLARQVQWQIYKTTKQ